MSDKDHGAKIQTVASHLPGLMDLKVWLYKIIYIYICIIYYLTCYIILYLIEYV